MSYEVLKPASDTFKHSAAAYPERAAIQSDCELFLGVQGDLSGARPRTRHLSSFLNNINDDINNKVRSAIILMLPTH